EGGGGHGRAEIGTEVVRSWEPGEPGEHVLPGADGQRGKRVLGVLGLEPGQGSGAGCGEERAGLALEERGEGRVEGAVAVVERDQQAGRRGGGLAAGQGPRRSGRWEA